MSDETTGNEGDGIKDLRKNFERISNENAELLKELKDFRTDKRNRDVGAILKEKGLMPEHAEFYTAEDISKDAVEKWADEKAALFGVTPGQSSNNQSADQSSVDRINGAMHTQPDALPAPNGQQRVLGDPEAIGNALATLPYDELVKLGYMPPNPGVYGPKGAQRR